MQRRTFANRSFGSCKLAMIAAHPMSLHFMVRFRMMHGTLCFAWSIWIVGRYHVAWTHPPPSKLLLTQPIGHSTASRKTLGLFELTYSERLRSQYSAG